MSEQTVNLTSILQNQVDKLTALSALLERELQLISSREAESLMALLDEKAQLLEDIQKIDAAAEALIDQGQTYSEEDEVLTEKAKALLDDCKYRTQVNQKAVEQGQLRLTHLRNLMMELRAKESLTYDKKGKPKGGTLGSGVSA
ncbi:flagellar export chaperone FlgN [Alteromonas hispanica]|uniref:Flagellar protein FlgN n=1 Tax=Alteromonas hispanica TaxID=315421 RepID=A0A6L9MRS7_9ALTE|nr:flagellar protein FlgN [Alteromonas hispanica]